MYKNTDTRFSVLMAVYSKDDPVLLNAALQSIVDQTFREAELILVEDGPISKSLSDVIEDFRLNINIKSVRLDQNRGLSEALNIGLSYVTTDIVFRADADDINRTCRFEIQLGFILNGYDLVGGAIEEYEKGLPIAIRSVPLCASQIKKFLKYRNPFNHMTVVFKKSKVLECGGYPKIHLKEDYALWAKMIARGVNVLNLSEVLVNANAGHSMFERRGGWGYVYSEIQIQKHLYNCGLKSLVECVWTGFIRSIIFLMPAKMRGFVYLSFLRS